MRSIAESNEPLVEGSEKIIQCKGLKQIFVARKAGYKAQEFSDMMNGRKIIKACDHVDHLACHRADHHVGLYAHHDGTADKADNHPCVGRNIRT